MKVSNLWLLNVIRDLIGATGHLTEYEQLYSFVKFVSYILIIGSEILQMIASLNASLLLI